MPFTYAVYFFFLRGQKEKVPKRKKPPPKTDLALLRLPMTARQIRFAQTPLVPVIGKLRIRSSTGRHARNGRCWQSCRVDFAWLPGKQHLSRKNDSRHRLIHSKAINSNTPSYTIITKISLVHTFESIRELFIYSRTYNLFKIPLMMFHR